jgi:hypothetical protein
VCLTKSETNVVFTRNVRNEKVTGVLLPCECIFDANLVWLMDLGRIPQYIVKIHLARVNYFCSKCTLQLQTKNYWVKVKFMRC